MLPSTEQLYDIFIFPSIFGIKNVTKFGKIFTVVHQLNEIKQNTLKDN